MLLSTLLSNSNTALSSLLGGIRELDSDSTFPADHDDASALFAFCEEVLLFQRGGGKEKGMTGTTPRTRRRPVKETGLGV